MNMSQVHLALTHIPVVLSLAGLVVLLISLFSKNSTISKVGFSILAIAGISALPVFFSGHEAEEAVEHLPGVSESLIERHEEVAKFALITILVAGTVALGGLIKISRPAITKGIRIAVLLLSFVSAGFMAQTAHLGGQIRHSEIRQGVVAQTDVQENNNDAQNDQEDDD